MPDERTRGQKIVDTKLKKYGPDYFKKLASHAGHFSTHRPYKDPEVAKRASLKGVEARRKKRLDKLTNHDHNQ